MLFSGSCSLWYNSSEFPERSWPVQGKEIWRGMGFCFFSFAEIPISSGFCKKKNPSSFCFPSFARCQMHTLKNHPPTWAACTGPEITASCQSDLKTNSLMTQGLFPLDSMVNIFRILLVTLTHPTQFHL